MKCPKCGYEQPESSYCKSCFNKIEKNIYFEITPIYDFKYMALPSIIVEGVATLFVSLVFLFFPIVSIIMLICGIIAITINIKCQKKHYEKNIYSFDNEKVRCINISKNKIKREMKYLDITGIEYKQSSLQKHHNLGNIILYNDVTVTGNNEILMRDVPNPMMYYNKIKEVIGIDKSNSDIIYQILPKFNIIYKIFSTIFLYFWVAFLIYIGATYNKSNKGHYIDYKIYLVVISVIFIFMIVYYFLDKKQLKKIKYNFYSHKFEYINKFWGTYMKEMRYNDIETIFIKQNPIQKIFNIGTIKLITKMSRLIRNRNGWDVVKEHFSINNIKNVENEYEKIMEIVDDEKYKN